MSDFVLVYAEIMVMCFVVYMYNCTQRRDWQFSKSEYIRDGVLLSIVWPLEFGYVIRDFIMLIRR